MFTTEILQYKANRNYYYCATNSPNFSFPKLTMRGIDYFKRQWPKSLVVCNSRTWIPEFLYGDLNMTIESHPIAVARSFLARISMNRNFKKSSIDLTEIDKFEWANQTYYKFQQVINGIPVFGSNLLLAFGEKENAKMLVTDILPEMPISSEIKIATTQDQAAEIALEDLDADVQLRDKIQYTMVYYPTQNGYEKCRQLIIPSIKPLGDWIYFINEKGKIVNSYNVMRFKTAYGNIYPLNPHATSLSIGLLHDLDSSRHLLKGPLCRVYNEQNENAMEANGDFRYDPEDTHFDEVNVYHHLIKITKYFQNLGFRGFKVNNPQGQKTKPKGQIKAHVHVGDSYDNAYYSETTGEIYFGDGSYPTNPAGFRDLAKEADVIYHEFSHAVMDELCPHIGGTDGAALHEGYADYFACSGKYPATPHLGTWVVPDLEMIRNLENDFKYSQASNECHERGLIWGGACWAFRRAVGAEIADFLIFKSLLLFTTQLPTFKYAKDRLLYADLIHFNSEFRIIIKKIFEKDKEIPV